MKKQLLTIALLITCVVQRGIAMEPAAAVWAPQKSKISVAKDKVGQFKKDHPYLSVGAVAVPVVIGVHLLADRYFEWYHEHVSKHVPCKK